MNVTYVVIFMAVTYGAVFFWWLQKKKKSKAAFDQLDMKQESIRAAAYLNELLQNQYPKVKAQMKDVPIEAMTVAKTEYTAGNQAKDIAKDALKSLATLGTVRFQTVQTSKYLVISGSDLHMLDTDTNGDISNHLVFNRQRLLNATIEETPVPSMALKLAQYGRYQLKSYKLLLSADDGKVLNIIFYNCILEVANTATVSALSNNTGVQVKQFVAGNYFLEKLGEKNPNLKVNTYLSK